MERSKPIPLSVRTRKITRAELKQIPTPAGSATWQPVGYYELIAALEKVMTDHNVNLEREEITIQHNGNRLYAIIDLQSGYGSRLPKAKTVSCCMGVLSSLNKRVGVQILTGLRVLSNDNLIFSTDHIGVRKRYTKGINLQEVIGSSFDDFIENYKILLEDMDRMRRSTISESQARLIIFEVFYARLFPLKWFHSVTKTYFSTEIKEFKPGNLWSLMNAIALASEKLRPDRKFQSLKQLSKIFHKLSKE